MAEKRQSSAGFCPQTGLSKISGSARLAMAIGAQVVAAGPAPLRSATREPENAAAAFDWGVAPKFSPNRDGMVEIRAASGEGLAQQGGWG